MNIQCTFCGNQDHPAGVERCVVCGHKLPNSQSISGTSINTNQENLPAISFAREFTVASNWGHNMTFNTQRSVVIGCGEDVDIRISGNTVQRHHAKLFVQDGQALIQAYALLSINGTPVSNDVTMLGENDIMTIEDAEFTVYASRPVSVNDPIARSQTQIIPENSMFDTVVQKTPQHRTYQDYQLFGKIVQIDGPHIVNPGKTPKEILRILIKAGLVLWKPVLGFIFPRDRQIQVRYVVVEQENGNQTPIIIKGEFESGFISLGNWVGFYGRWINGTLIMTSAYNETYHAHVVISSK